MYARCHHPAKAVINQCFLTGEHRRLRLFAPTVKKGVALSKMGKREEQGLACWLGHATALTVHSRLRHCYAVPCRRFATLPTISNSNFPPTQKSLLRRVGIFIMLVFCFYSKTLHIQSKTKALRNNRSANLLHIPLYPQLCNQESDTGGQW